MTGLVTSGGLSKQGSILRIPLLFLVSGLRVSGDEYFSSYPRGFYIFSS